MTFRRPRNPLLSATSVLAVIAFGSLAHGEIPAPFVAGFDRFARHQVIDPVVAGSLLSEVGE